MLSQTTAPAGSPTPAMRQYLDAKRLHRDAIVFFRMGDFYEMFYEDALTASRALDLTLTSRAKDSAGGPIPMCGVPHHAADTYVARLVRKGFRVAICEQVEDPKKAKGVVRREVVRVVSPGTLTDTAYLDAREPAFLLAIAASPHHERPRTGGPAAAGPRDVLGVALLDVSTGEFTTTEYSGAAGYQALDDEIGILRPREIVTAEGFDWRAVLPHTAQLGIPVTHPDVWMFELETARRALLEQLRTHGLEGYGLEGRPEAICAAGCLVQYLRDTQKGELAHVRSVAFREARDCVLVDPTTMRHLEIIEASDGTRTGSLLHQLDCTITSMGARNIRRWLLRPLISLERIQDRLDAVEDLAFRATDRAKLREILKFIQDLERLVARAALGTAGPRDLVGLKTSLSVIPRLRSALQESQAPLVTSLLGQLDDLTDVRDDVEATLVNEPAALAREGGCIREGVDPELDELRTISRSGRQRIAEMEERERARTGISSLKIRYNRVFGY